MSPNFHVNISEQFTIREYMRPSFEGSVNMDLQKDVDEDDYLRKEVSCSKTTFFFGDNDFFSPIEIISFVDPLHRKIA